jgi:histidine triad (HIT) family protein
MPDCLFCRIVRKEVPARILYEDETVLAFKDVYPKAPVHVLVIPKKHIPSVMDLEGEDFTRMGDIHRVIQSLVKQQNPKNGSFRLVVNTGPDAGQTVEHLHYHFLAGRSFTWPPG